MDFLLFYIIPLSNTNFSLVSTRCAKKLFHCPIRNTTHFAPRAVVGMGPRFRPRTAVANDIFHSQVVFIQLCLFAGTAGARGADDHFIITPFYPCAVQCKRKILPRSAHHPERNDLPPPALTTVVEPPAVLFKYADYTGPFAPILAQHGRCWFCVLINNRLDLAGKLHDISLYQLIYTSRLLGECILSPFHSIFHLFHKLDTF